MELVSASGRVDISVKQFMIIKELEMYVVTSVEVGCIILFGNNFEYLILQVFKAGYTIGYRIVLLPDV